MGHALTLENYHRRRRNTKIDKQPHKLLVTLRSADKKSFGSFYARNQSLVRVDLWVPLRGIPPTDYEVYRGWAEVSLRNRLIVSLEKDKQDTTPVSNSTRNDSPLSFISSGNEVGGFIYGLTVAVSVRI